MFIKIEKDIYRNDMKILSCMVCCKKMQTAWKEDYIGLGDNKKVCIYVTDFEDGILYTHEMPIAFCPFCSTEITVSENDTLFVKYSTDPENVGLPEIKKGM